MRQLMSATLIGTALLALGGCGAPKPIKYYGLQIPSAPMPSGARYSIDLVVGRIAGSDLLEASPIIYRTSHNEIGTYTYHRWTESPVEMVQAKLIRLLRVSGDYQSVAGLGSPSGGGDLVIRGRLYDFSEVDGDAITGVVTMEFELYNRKSNKILWTHFYSQTEPVTVKEVPAVVQALDRNLDRGLKEVAAGLNQYFATTPPVRTNAAAQSSPAGVK